MEDTGAWVSRQGIGRFFRVLFELKVFVMVKANGEHLSCALVSNSW